MNCIEFSPSPSSLTYNKGDLFRIAGPYGSSYDIYMLCAVGISTYHLINLETGNRFADTPLQCLDKTIVDGYIRYPKGDAQYKFIYIGSATITVKEK